MPHDIFISYSSQERPSAEQLCQALKSSGYSVWMDTGGIDGAMNWSGEIVRAINECNTLLFLISRNSVSSHNCAKELQLASEKLKHILPVVLEDVPLPVIFEYPLAGLQRVPIDDTPRILKALARLTGGRTVLEGMAEISSRSDSDQLRLAVLPFEDLSPSHDNQWFSDGLSDELISTMNKLDRIFVVDKQTSRNYRQSSMHAAEIGRELNVRYLVRGAVRKAGDQIRIQADLVDTVSGKTLWDEKFPGTMEDIFEIQERVAREIATGMSLKLTAKDEQKIEERITKSTVAYELYLRAASIGDRITKKDYWQAIQLFDNVIEVDPGLCEAYCSQANCLVNYYKKFDHNPEYLQKAEQRLEQAKNINPEASKIYSNYGLLFEALGRPADALAAAQHAVKLDPKDSRVYFLLGFLFSDLNRLPEAIEAYEKTIALNPEFLHAHYNCALMNDRLGDSVQTSRAAERAIPYYRKYLAVHPDDSSSQMSYAFLLDMSGRHEESLHQVSEILRHPEVDPAVIYDAACLNIRNGNLENGFDLLRRSVRSGSRHKEMFLTDPDLDPLRTKPEFMALISELDQLIEEESHG